MTVDFVFKKAPKFRAITAAWKGPWNEKRIQKEFEALDAWAKKNKIRTGRWVFMEPGDRQWLVGLEVPAATKGDGSVRVRSFPASRVAQVQFDPDVVSARVVYHGVTDWLRWRK